MSFTKSNATACKDFACHGKRHAYSLPTPFETSAGQPYCWSGKASIAAKVSVAT
jgi:hypothetical protein